jgi:transcriptional regulator with XRE-family HTH domain
MGKAAEALQQTLEQYKLGQSQLAKALGVERPTVFRWFHGHTDPPAQTMVQICEVLRTIDPSAADFFIQAFLGSSPDPLPPPVIFTAPQVLPDSDRVNVAALSAIFANTTNSYKYLFFTAILEILRRRQFESLSSISFQELVIEMLASAWYPHTYFKLSFGKQDQIAQKLDTLNLNISEPILKFTDSDKKLLRKTILDQNPQDIINALSRYVPFRLLNPFLVNQLKGVDKGKGNVLDLAMPQIAADAFESEQPLYKFNSVKYAEVNAIELHPAWVSYFEQHYTIVKGWAAWEWLGYMQRRNPSTPGLMNKLFMPTKRDSLAKQTKFWKLVLKYQPLTCIYSGESLDSSTPISLDHYLPWSFVAHDQLWNLIPTLPAINSAKSNHLPSPSLLDNFIKIQHSALVISHNQMKSSEWQGFVEPYEIDLGISIEKLTSFEDLREAYGRVIEPLISLAKTQGFQVWNQ